MTAEWMQVGKRDYFRNVVYVLMCPDTGDIRYVGCTGKPQCREQEHTKRVYKNPKTPVQAWTSRLVTDGTPPKFQIVAEVKCAKVVVNRTIVGHADTGLLLLEKEIVDRCILAGCDLLNVRHVLTT